jgi:hypothetical protein
MSNTANIILDIFILIFVSIGILTSVGILYLIYYNRHEKPIDTPILLLCNTYLAVIITCLPLLDMYAHNLYGNSNENISFDTWWCYGRAYLLHVGIHLIYYSYLLQSCFRFFRIVLYKYKQLQNFRFMLRLVFIQWLLAFLLILPILFLHHFQYVPEYHYCQIPFYDLYGLLIGGSIIYYFPMIMIGSIYFYIIYHMHKTKNVAIQQNRQRTNQRDAVVLRRIIILVGMLFFLSFPTILVWIVYIITGYLHPFIYDFQWLTFALSLSILPMAPALLTPYLKHLITFKWRDKHHIHPMIVTQQLELRQRIAGL